MNANPHVHSHDSHVSNEPKRLTARIPSLDGIRGISILFVVFSHVGGALKLDNQSDFFLGFYRFIGNGRLGVSIFFVLSGFLITTLLLREEESTGRVSWRNFFVRRVFRILPPFYFYLLVVTGYFLLSGVDFSQLKDGFTPSFFFLTDYVRWSSASYYHGLFYEFSWSLGVEEKFYLLWPIAFIFLDRKNLVRFCWALVLAVPIVRSLAYHFNPAEAPHLWKEFHSRMDSLMVGCLLAILWDSPQMLWLKRHVLRPTVIAPLAAFTVVGSQMLMDAIGFRYLVAVGYTLEAFSIALLVAWLVELPESRTARLFNSRPLVHLGQISYSLYIWHEFFLYGPTKALFPLSLLFGWLAAEFSFHVIEKRALQLRGRFLRPTPSRKPVAIEPTATDLTPA